MTTTTFRNGPWAGEVHDIRNGWATRDIYPFPDRTGFYFQYNVDEPVWDWIPFEFGKNKLADKLRELGLE